MRSNGISRLTAVVATGVLILFAASGPVAAQPTPSGPADQAGFAKPPPLPADTPTPPDTGKPDLPYEQKTQCVRSLNATVDLINKPWGQNQLRFDELHKFATGAGQTVAVIDTGVNQHD